MQLNLPEYPLRMQLNKKGDKEVLDVFRRKFVRLTPEEEVRQQFLNFLVYEKGFVQSLIGVERQLMVNSMTRRFDAVVFTPNGQPLVLIEFKAPSVKISQQVFDQIAAYNFVLKADYLMVSNGMTHYACKMDYQNHSYLFLENIPPYESL
ncbi:MAG: type I restriction enzyme HsdR N-terminal domain-containing protein [Bacteroidales bacterium]|nr:type I restriction enzyme HsdR N-terminal domain-containing protein [Bacteroidales bacterium]